MSFTAKEQSLTDGRPVELYTFSRDYQVWRYTSADRDIATDGGTFLSRAISRSAIESSPERSRSNLTITAQRDLEVAELYRVTPPTMVVTCTVQQLHDSDSAREIATIWSGRVSGVEFNGTSAQISVEPVNSSLRRVGLRRLYQRQCPHVLYGTRCGANREAFRTDGTVDSISTGVVVVPEADLLADGYFAGGFIEWEIALGIVERRFISDHAGANLAITSLTQGLVPGQAVKLYPGCDHTLTTCAAKFSNSPNFGGFPFFPLKNPFGSDPVF